MIIIKLLLIKNIDTLFICDAQAIYFVYQHFDNQQIDGCISKIDI
jgi:hypothetical protein